MNDIYTFALALHSFGSEIQHGWLAYKSSQCDDFLENKSALPGGHCHPCSSDSESANAKASSLVSDFCACNYLRHVKGGTAIMARQHTERSDPEISGVQTTDQELLLPRKYFPIDTHIDHRLACGDKRSVYNQIWSLRQLK